VVAAVRLGRVLKRELAAREFNRIVDIRNTHRSITADMARRAVEFARRFAIGLSERAGQMHFDPSIGA
jgi:hypothetical protein